MQLADASNALKMPAVGLLKQDLANNAEGFAVVTGKLRNLITDPIDGINPTENEVIYVKPSGTSGAALTTTKPVYGNFIQNIGKVGRVSTAADGNLVVSSILRTNDIPNLTPGRLWVGSTGNTIESQTLFVDEANGRLGIGTTIPAGKLEVNGGTGVATSGGTLIVRQEGDTSNDGIALTSSNSISHRMFKNAGGTFLMGPSTDSDAFALDLNGNVGIGTTSPGEKLEVNGNILVNKGTTNRTAYLSDDGLYISRTSNGGYTNKIVADSSNSNNLNINARQSVNLILDSLTKLKADASGQIQFNDYGAGTFTGTATKNLAVDTNGNVIETDGSIIDGSGS